MDAFRQWALCIIIAAAAGTFVCAVSPRGSTDKTVRAIVGIFVVAAICTPLSRLDYEDLSLPVFADSYNTEGADGELDEYIVSSCKSAIESEIMMSASEYGITVESIIVDADVDTDKCMIIHNIQINIQNCETDYLSDFSKAVEEKLGVPVTLTAD